MKTILSILFGLVMLALAIGAAWGWVWNIIKLIHMVGGDITTMFVLRIVGIFAAPLGVILGYF